MTSYCKKIASAARLLRTREYSLDEITSFRRSQLNKLISHAYETVPYYRRLFKKNGIHPRNIRNENDLSIIPITHKKDIQKLPIEDLISSNCKLDNLIRRLTHGSTGEPLTVRRTWLEERLLQVRRRRAYQYLGVRIKDKRADIYQ